MPLTYLEFHLSFLVPPLFALAALTAVRWQQRRVRLRVVGVAAVTLLALLYTTPWDNYLVRQGVWSYGDGRVFGTLWHAPIEEYLFVAVQPLVTALWLYQLPDGVDASIGMVWRDRFVGALAGVGVGVAGVALLATESTYYLGAILAWAGPVLALQWGVGWRYLWRRRRRVVLGVAVPTAYLAAADALAIRAGVWTINERYTTGLALAGLPIEEATFFLVTNLFVVQGLVLLPWVVRRWR